MSRRADPRRRRLRHELLEDRRLLATVTVGNLNDVVNGAVTSIADLIATPGGDGISLREAILAANADAAADSIDFAPSVAGTIQLTNVDHAGEVVISNNLTINGPGANVLTIRGFAGTAAVGDGARIFNVDDGNLGSFKDISISGLTLAGGDVNASGGAIRNGAENLTVTGCVISGNSAVSGGGLHNNSGHLSVSGCAINGNTVLGSGAGIETLGGSLTVVQSTVSGNSTPFGGAGGGIHSSASTATIESSTISGNSANYGGGISHTGVGILMTITGSTVSGNRARINGGGVLVVQGDVILRHSTITGNRADEDNNGTGNGGGAYVLAMPSNVTIDHTIVAGNLRSTSTRDDISGEAAARYSLVGVNTGATITDNGGNLIGTGASPINPVLGPLADNGGPTLTHAFLAGSPALDAGDLAAMAGVGTVPQNDQRGATLARIADGDSTDGARIDIGAYEQQSTQAVDLLVVDTVVDEDDGNTSPSHFSLREAIRLANASTGPNTITFAAPLTSAGPATILLTRGQLAITQDMTIDGPGANLLTIDGTGGFGARLFFINDGSAEASPEVEITGLTLTGGDMPTEFDIFGGGAIFNVENLTVIACTISDNEASQGGGISNLGGNLVVSRSTIHGNLVNSFNVFSLGGGIFSSGGSLTVIDSTISDNFCESSGGGIYSSGGSLTVIDSTVSDNICESSGGGVFIGSGTATVANSTISGNDAQAGGGIYNASSFGSLTVRHSTICSNFTDGIRDVNGGVTLDHTIVAGNVFDLSAPTFDAPFSQIGVGAQFLGPLADNGGPNRTHALLPGSPAIDAGDPAAVAGASGVPHYDQRGFAFSRVVNGRIDIGAFEQGAESADFDLDLDVDGFDFLAWQRGFGATGAEATRAGGNADNDSDVDGDDLAVWHSQFGSTSAAAAAESAALVSHQRQMALTTIAVDAALAYQQWSESQGARPRRGPRLPRR